MIVSQAIEKMIAFYKGNIHDIDHFIKVWAYAKTIGELEGLDDRIAKMAANRDRFVTAKAAILAALDLAPATGWDAVQARLRRAQDAARDGERLAAEIAGDRSQIETDRRRLNDAQREIAALGAALGWTEADGSLAAHVGRCL